MTSPRDEKPPPETGRGRPAQGDPMIPSPTKIETSVTPPRPPRIGCICGHVDGEACVFDVPAVDRYRARLGLPPVEPNPGTCRCQRACWVGSPEQGNARFVCVCRQEAS